MTLERYRIWLKNGKYKVAVAHNRQEAVNIVKREEGVREKSIKAVGKATSKGRLYKYPFESEY